MKNRKLQRVLTWILTLTMILGTFGETGLALQAADDDAVAEAEAVDAGDADVPDPDQYTDDATLTFDFNPKVTVNSTTAEVPSHAKIAIPNGSLEKPWEAQAAETWTTDATKKYDSKFGVSVYVVPELGYTFGDDAEAWAETLIINGGWRLKEAEEAVTDITSAYTVEAVSVDEADTDIFAGSVDGVHEYNWKKALKITFTAGSDLAKAFEGQADGTIEFVADDPKTENVDESGAPFVTIAPIAVEDTLPVFIYYPDSVEAVDFATATFNEVFGKDGDIVIRSLSSNPTYAIAAVGIVM